MLGRDKKRYFMKMIILIKFQKLLFHTSFNTEKTELNNDSHNKFCKKM
jgi:hypothetical protein